ncbi:MAG TPA: alpha/beta fold hydrolase [Byssovorax sp.]
MSSGRGDEARPRPPVLLVHGIWKTGATFDALARRLRRDGLRAHAVDLRPNDGSAPIAELARSALAEADRVFGADAPFDVVGFSMGGLVARYLAQRLVKPPRVARFVSVSAPQAGTWAAHLSGKAGAVEMRPGSALLRDLASDVDRLSALDVTSIWTPLDLMILPAESSRLPVGRAVLVGCPLHGLMLRDPRCIGAVAEALARR